MKVAELTKAQLDYWVAKAEGIDVRWVTYEEIGKENSFGGFWHIVGTHPFMDGYAPSSDWSRGGPIIEREKFHVWPHATGWSASFKVEENTWIAGLIGETPLIAAMRCYVLRKFGDEVPDEAK